MPNDTGFYYSDKVFAIEENGTDVFSIRDNEIHVKDLKKAIAIFNESMSKFKCEGK